jgi:hypothetical protein
MMGRTRWGMPLFVGVVLVPSVLFALLGQWPAALGMMLFALAFIVFLLVARRRAFAQLARVEALSKTRREPLAPPSSDPAGNVGRNGWKGQEMGGAVLAFDRARVLAYRVGVQGFDRSSSTPGVLTLGAQDTPSGSARVALAARGASADGMETVWSFRGAPHLHHTSDVAQLAAALWPVDDADATARIDTAVIKQGARLGVEAFRVTARAFRDVVSAPTPKGEVSTAVSAALPESLTYWCAPCGARHVSGLLFQQAGLSGGVRVLTEGRRTLLEPFTPGFPLPAAAAGTSGLVRAYLGYLGPAAPADVAKHLGTRPAAVRAVWPDGLTEVRVDGRRAWLPEERLDALRAAQADAGLVRLLPPGDPLLQGRDRALLVPEKERAAHIWRPVGSPGVLLVGAEPVGTWRARSRGRALELTATPFVTLRPAVRRALEVEAERVAAARGFAEARLVIA